MSAPTPPRNSSWLERAGAEIQRGRHLILHGNIHDLVLWRGEYDTLENVLDGLLHRLGYGIVGFYDPIDHMRIRPAEAFERFTALADPVPDRGGIRHGGRDRGREEPALPEEAEGGRLAAIDRRLGRAATDAPKPVYERPLAALGAIRRSLAQDQEPTAFVVDCADLLLLHPDHHDQSDRQVLGTAKKAMLGAAEVDYRRNILILLAGDLAAVPEWLHRNEPFVETVEVPRPTAEERESYLTGLVGRFHAADLLDPGTVERSIRALANLSEDMALTELDGLWRTSRVQRIALDEPRELINSTRFGRRTDRWARLDRFSPDEVRARLGARVLGQDAAVDRVSRALSAATIGIDFAADPFSPEARPKGVFFFVGPTGVGKTELARALSELVFDDETAMCRFDMSSFAEPHNAERFYGAPPGFVGHERGGELTNRMHQRPFSVLLFDEVEKAHESIFDKFLQILEDGRLVDGLGRTAYFSQSLIIFTSNLGADSVYRRVEQADASRLPSYKEVSEHFERAVREHFARRLRRPELLGRLGDAVVSFDIVRPDHIPGIVRKFTGYLSRNAARKQVSLDIDDESVVQRVQEAMRDPATAALGYRQVPVILSRVLRDPLVRELAERGRSGRLYARIEAGDDVATISRSDAEVPVRQ